jgi:plasmid stabilization system protein ParE
MKQVRFSELSVFKLEKLVAYLSEEWSDRSSKLFLNKLNATLETVRSNPKAFPESQVSKGLRKCVITKQTTVLYEIHQDAIVVMNIIDARQNPKKIEEEIKTHFWL